MSQKDQDQDIETNLVQDIKNSESNSEVVTTILRTDERVIARVTDGIYRQPASALRELISNAYDADAKRVVIKTDAPRFDRISIEDDGLGMTPEALAHMLLHIGGSAKRQAIGKSLGITDSSNPLVSPGGRKLIGKIGIGIFSVAQLTHTFQIITKTKGDDHRTVAVVALKQYSDDGSEQKGQNEKYESGKVNIWREKASDKESHGTSIILTNIRPQARDTLRSRETWSAIEQSSTTTVVDEHQHLDPPKFHIGRVDATGELLETNRNTKTTSLPWSSTDSHDEAFKKLVQAVWDETQYSNPNPQLEKIFDYYLQMVWQLSLAVPLPYVEGHLFDMDLSTWAKAFQITNEPKGSAKELSLKPGEPIRKRLNLVEGSVSDNFDVYFDDLKLQRPIKFKNLPMTGHAIKTPLIFLGKCREEFSKYSSDLSGGPLEFEAYLFWTPKIVPTEHRGSLIRVNGASGTLFDSSFMKYQVSEQTRLRQITCEIFIHQGFDSSLNIDRESFNFAHPHAVYLTRWLHSALRQLATAQKKVASEIREETRNNFKSESLNNIQKVAIETWHAEQKDIDSSPPTISIENSPSQPELIQSADIVLNRDVIAPKRNETRRSPVIVAQQTILDEKIKAITQVLASFGLLEKLNSKEQERLLRAIYQILEITE